MMDTYNDSSRREDLKGGKKHMAKKNWIKGAIKHPGAFTKKAKKAGKSVSGFAASVLKKGSKASTQTKRQASLARTLSHSSRGSYFSKTLFFILTCYAKK